HQNGKDPLLKLEFKRHVLQKLSVDSEQDLWKKSAKIITQVGKKILGKTSGKGGPQDKETWWWNDEVKVAIKKKKDMKKKWDLSGRDEDKREYREANKESTKAVAIAKVKELDEVYKELETPEGEKKIYRIAKARDLASKDLTHIRQVKNGDGLVLRDENAVKTRWREYFNTLLNKENPREAVEEREPNQGIVREIERSEVELALSSMKNGKAQMAYDRVPREEIWKCMRAKGTPEKYVRIVRDMYEDAVTKVRSSVGVTEEIPVQVCLQQGSALSPYLFDLIMDVLTEDVRKKAPWCMMFADDIVLCEESVEDMERELERWKIPAHISMLY
ncbi:uncharacterized protein LOC103509649, partial [Diaphorina citri]|uniref:Uncharacterized protein LOC103509649 n=1 Tax=Diaphorina citri TaxID=121845 RepID=A0A1S3D390_DIACI